jgi:predicted nucleic acid-binding protein
MMVLDASAILDLLLRTSSGDRVLSRVSSASETLHAPEVVDLEVAQALRRLQAARQLTPRRADEALEDFLALDVARYAHRELLPRIWQLRSALSAYDAAYVALAEVLGAPLLTTDQRLARAKGHAAHVECVR